jgi:hypothetical protein
LGPIGDARSGWLNKQAGGGHFLTRHRSHLEVLVRQRLNTLDALCQAEYDALRNHGGKLCISPCRYIHLSITSLVTCIFAHLVNAIIPAMSFFEDDTVTARPRTADGAQRPVLLKRPTLGSRNVSFDPGVQLSKSEKRPEHKRNDSDWSAPDIEWPLWKQAAHIQRIDRHAQNVDP